MIHTTTLRCTAGPIAVAALMFVAPALAAQSFDLQPDVWNVNWTNSDGTVSALLRGPDVASIDEGTIQLLGTDLGEGLPPLRVQRNDKQLRALFSKSAAIALVGDAEPGDVVTMTLRFLSGGEAQELT